MATTEEAEAAMEGGEEIAGALRMADGSIWRQVADDAQFKSLKEKTRDAVTSLEASAVPEELQW